MQFISLLPFCIVLVSSIPISTQRVPIGKPQYRETFLAGSEFEESLITHLLNSSTLKVLDDDITLLLASTNLTYTIIDSDKPFDFVDRHYYWSQEKFNETSESENSTNFSNVCIFNTTSDPGIFSQLCFSNGEQVQELVFGCENGKECCGLKCCGDDVLINIIIVAAISIALLFLLLCNILIGFKKRRSNKKQNTSGTVYEVDATPNTIEAVEEIDAGQITLQTRHPATANYHPNAVRSGS